MKFSRNLKRLTTGAGVMGVGLAIVGGVAIAYWTASGSGSVTSKSYTATPLGITAIAAPATDLYPGTTKPLVAVVSNPNPYTVVLDRLLAANNTNDNVGLCPAGNVTLPSAIPSVLPTVSPIPDSGGALLPALVTIAPSASATATLSTAVAMATGAPDGCQGRTFTWNVAVGGTQQ